MILHLLRKKRFIAILIILLIMIILSPAVSSADADRIFKENNKAVVVVVAYDQTKTLISQGSGFIIQKDGALVTNYHIISNAKVIEIKVGNKILRVEGLLYIDKENDLVVLKPEEDMSTFIERTFSIEVSDFPVVKLGDSDKIDIGEKIYVISSPQGLENTISDGIISGIREISPKRKILQITAPISEGSSGGPVFNKKGEVIGIATFLIKDAQNINFAMPINLIKDKILAKQVTALKDAEIEDYKKTAEYWFTLGYGYGELGLYREAINAYKQVIKIKPDHADAHNNLGIAYVRVGKNREAIEAFKKAIRIKPDFAEAHYNLGVYYDKLGMYQEAIEALKQAIRVKPDYADAHNNLGVAYVRVGKNREAIEAFKKAIRIKPDFAMAHYNLGLDYVMIGNKGLAFEQYKILRDLDPELAEELFNLIYK